MLDSLTSSFGWTTSYPVYRQRDQKDCGPTALRMVAKYHGQHFSIRRLREQCFVTRRGASLLDLSSAAEQLGFRTLGVKTTYEALCDEAPLPGILHWNQNHFVVLYEADEDGVTIADPAHGLVDLTREEFLDRWATRANGDAQGVVLLLDPTPELHAKEEDDESKTGFRFLLPYVTRHKKLIGQVLLGLGVAGVLQLLFPLITQVIVDVGVANQDIDFIYLVLMAQIALFVGQISVEFIRRWIILHVGTRVNVELISDFLAKLTRLPVSHFESKQVGDILQRVNDHERIEEFLSNQTLNVLLSLFSLVVFGIVLAVYSLTIFGIFVVGSVLHVTYIVAFLEKRSQLDYKLFDRLSEDQDQIVEIVQGIEEIKLNGAEQQKRWDWERVQSQLFEVKMDRLRLDQYQEGGSSFINEMKNILITFTAALLVIQGQLTLGMLLAVQYIIGQLNGPLNQMISFFRTAQDAKISLDRLGEVHGYEDEDRDETGLLPVPDRGDLVFDDVSFRYGGPHSPLVLENVNLRIPRGQTTAIVGESGSGKSTLLKLILKFAEPTEGKVKLGGTDLQLLSSREWRQQCGVVAQDGYIFSDTVARNIAVGTEHIDYQRVGEAAAVANIRDHVESLARSYKTEIGQNGVGLSEGQKQRILIARAVYSDPDFFFFDEPTSALDAQNEREITQQLNQFAEGRTVVVIAHRLSTVKNADQIVVLDDGTVAESGTHAELTEQRGTYYQLVREQIELG